MLKTSETITFSFFYLFFSLHLTFSCFISSTYNHFFLSFQSTVTSVQNSIEAVKQHQAQSRMHVIKDWYLVTGNNKYVMWWSMSQICIIVFTSAAQVYSLRRLFRAPVASTSFKPRAWCIFVILGRKSIKNNHRVDSWETDE